MEAIPVLMTLSGRAYGGTVEEEEVVDLMTTGLLYPLKEGWKLTYTETQPDDNTTSEVTLLMGHDRVLMSRSGEYGSSMVFRKDRRFGGLLPHALWVPEHGRVSHPGGCEHDPGAWHGGPGIPAGPSGKLCGHA